MPNGLTVLRIALIPAFLFDAQQVAATGLGDGGGGEEGMHRALAVGALLGIGLSDVVDGWLARRFGVSTALGAVLDALADKLAQVCLLGFFVLAEGAAFATVPAWFFAVVIGRDVLLGGGALVIRRCVGTVEVVHRAHGRAATVLLFLLLLWITADWPRRAGLDAFMIAIAAVIVVSTVDYIRAGYRQIAAPGARRRA